MIAAAPNIFLRISENFFSRPWPPSILEILSRNGRREPDVQGLNAMNASAATSELELEHRPFDRLILSPRNAHTHIPASRSLKLPAAFGRSGHTNPIPVGEEGDVIAAHQDRGLKRGAATPTGARRSHRAQCRRGPRHAQPGAAGSQTPWRRSQSAAVYRQGTRRAFVLRRLSRSKRPALPIRMLILLEQALLSRDRSSPSQYHRFGDRRSSR